MRKFFILLAFTINIISYCQNYKPGQMTLENNELLNGTFFFNEPNNTPQSFRYKNEINSKEIKTLEKKDFKYLKLDNTEFTKATVEISRHQEAVQNLSFDDKFDLKKEELILEILVNGSYKLYKFIDDKNTAYFYSSINETEIKPLLYKEYYDSNTTGTLIKNSYFRNTLHTISCQKTNVDYIKYNESELIKFFKKNNECSGDTTQTFKENTSENYLKIVASKNFPKEKYSIYDISSSYSFGLEYEKILPFLNNRFSFAFAANYTIINADIEKSILNNKNTTSQINVAIIARHYIINQANYKFYLGTTLFDWISSKNHTRTLLAGNPLETSTEANLLFVNNLEAGFKFKDFEIFGTFNISNYHLQKNSSSIGVKYTLPFLKK